MARGKAIDVNFAVLFTAGASYSMFAGRDATRGLAMSDLDPDNLDQRPGDISDLDATQQQTLQQWVTMFEAKYPAVGVLLQQAKL